MDEPGDTRVVVEHNVPARMRDGVVLRADIYRPAREGRYPALLQRTPYNKAFLQWVNFTMDVIRAARAGYMVIVQDVRGRWESEGKGFNIYRDEFDDGYDTVEWAASLPYCDGNVGMFGYSYYASTQWRAAAMRPPHLKAIFPFAGAMDHYFHRGGALELGALVAWLLLAAGPNAIMRARAGTPELRTEFMELVHSIDHIEEVFRTLPLKDISAVRLGDGFAPYFYDVLEHAGYDDYHKGSSILGRHKDVQVPAYIFTGWYDLLLDSDLTHFLKIRSESDSEIARAHTRLVVGPWTHLGILDSVGHLHFGLGASTLMLELRGDITARHIAWFDHWLKGIQNSIPDEPPVKIFVMGENRWRSENEWPLARTQYTPFYFHSAGRANSSRGDGVLSLESPREELPDRFVYDPSDPVPTWGGNHILPLYYPRGPADQRHIEERLDVLIYTSEALGAPLEVTGPVVAELYASSSARDTDFTAKLVDVHPDGRAFNVADGILRARFREGDFVEPTLIQPNSVIKYRVNMSSTSHLFKAGHRIRMEISSSNFPRFDRNPNTGELAHEARRLETGMQTVFHDPRYPSHVLLPVIPR
jgi:uncharacterized protein